MLRLLRRPVRRKPLFRRGHRHRRPQGQRSAAAIAELGAVPALGKRPLHRSVAALFFRQPVLEASSVLSPSLREQRSNPSLPHQESFVGWAKARLRRAHRLTRRTLWWARFALPTLRSILLTSQFPGPGESLS